jgi:hypothetical protein
MWAGRPAASFMVALLTMVGAALLVATPAWASSPSDVRVEFSPPQGNHAGQQTGYRVFFTATSALTGSFTSNDSITISAPAGTVFPDGGTYTLINLTTGRAYPINDDLNGSVFLSDGGSTVTIYLSGARHAAIAPGDLVVVNISFVTNPSEPGQYTLSVSTSSDTTPATSAPYTVLPALVGGPPPVPEVPTSKEQCKKGGYEAFDFRNQGQCVAFVERGSKN